MKDVICAVFGGREDGSILKVREDSEMTRHLGYKSIQWQGTPLPPLRCILCLMEYLDCLEYWTVSTSHKPYWFLSGTNGALSQVCHSNLLFYGLSPMWAKWLAGQISLYSRAVVLPIFHHVKDPRLTS